MKNKQTKDPNKIVQIMGFRDFADYLESDVYLSIVESVCEKKRNQCCTCKSKEGHNIGYANYTYGNLSGENLSHVFPLCNQCLSKVNKHHTLQGRADYLNHVIKQQRQQKKQNKISKQEKLKRAMRHSANQQRGLAKKNASLFYLQENKTLDK